MRIYFIIVENSKIYCVWQKIVTLKDNFVSILINRKWDSYIQNSKAY